ncbi:MAG: BON domain-containing protein [bacterium]|nr:BON domain-containing protein [bacterium]
MSNNDRKRRPEYESDRDEGSGGGSRQGNYGTSYRGSGYQGGNFDRDDGYYSRGSDVRRNDVRSRGGFGGGTRGSEEQSGDLGADQGNYERYWGERQRNGGAWRGLENQRDRQQNPGMERGGQFAGRGPKGYRRSDDRIMEDVCEILTMHDDIDASEIEVQVQQGVVTLSGTVDSRRTKRMAEDVIESISGVVDIHNQLRVQPNGQTWGQSEPGKQGGGHNGQGQMTQDRSNETDK